MKKGQALSGQALFLAFCKQIRAILIRDRPTHLHPAENSSIACDSQGEAMLLYYRAQLFVTVLAVLFVPHNFQVFTNHFADKLLKSDFWLPA